VFPLATVVNGTSLFLSFPDDKPYLTLSPFPIGWQFTKDGYLVAPWIGNIVSASYPNLNEKDPVGYVWFGGIENIQPQLTQVNNKPSTLNGASKFTLNSDGTITFPAYPTWGMAADPTSNIIVTQTKSNWLKFVPVAWSAIAQPTA
jgi:hypothetical protein